MLESLGRGGFGTVYRAELLTDGGFRRFVALKLLHEERASVADRARFHDEAQLLALIRHRSIVGVDALVELDGRWAMVMELVEGADLDRLLRRGAPPLRASLQIIEEIASALVAAFETVVDGRRLGLVHRDLKHGNVRVTLRGEVKLLDFGIASGSFEGRLAETATGEVMGTLRFMAPERMEGASGPATDVYSLGVMACDLLTGAALPPTSALRPGEQRALVRARLAEIDPDAPSEVSDLVSAMLSFEPASRPDAREVAARCRALAQAAPGPSLDTWARSAIERLPPTRSAPDATTSEWVGRTLSEASVTARAAPPWSRPSVLAAAGLGVAGVVAAGAAAVVVGVAGIASASWLAMRLARDPPAGLGEGDLVLTELPVWETDIEGLALSADGAVLTYTDGTVGRVDLEAGSFGSLGEGLGGSPSRSGEESFVLTGFPLRAARLAVDGTRTSVPTHDAVELAPAPGDRLVYTSALGLSSGGLSRSVLRELDLTGGTDRILVDQGAAASSPSVNDAGVLAWRVENDGLYTLGPAGEVREGLRGAFVDVGWRSDEALYVLERVGTTSKLSVSRVGPDGAMSPPEEVVSSDGEINEIATSPSTGRVAFVAAQRQRGFVLYPTTGKPVRRDVGARGWDYTLSPDGTRFAMLREPPSGPTTGPSGRRALAVGIEEVQSNVGDHWLALDVDTARNLRWCPDGSCLWVEGAVDGQWRLLEVALGAGEAREILSLPGGSQGAVGSPDGRESPTPRGAACSRSSTWTPAQPRLDRRCAGCRWIGVPTDDRCCSPTWGRCSCGPHQGHPNRSGRRSTQGSSTTAGSS